MFTVIAGAFAGAVVTVFLGRDPGFALGLLVFLATAVAVFAVRPTAVYLVIPVPTLAYVAAAVGTGYIHDRATDTSHTALALSAVQWTAGGFVAMASSTALAIVVTLGRWLLARHRTGPRYEDYDAVIARRLRPASAQSAAGRDDDLRPADGGAQRSASGMPADPRPGALYRARASGRVDGRARSLLWVPTTPGARTPGSAAGRR